MCEYPYYLKEPGIAEEEEDDDDEDQEEEEGYDSEGTTTRGWDDFYVSLSPWRYIP